MVFYGLPSRNCTDCRIRRIKCDQQRPSCSQCIRAGKTCQGYRDLSAVRIRDESHAVVKKGQARAQARATKAQRPRNDGEREPSASTSVLPTAAFGDIPIHLLNESSSPPPRIPALLKLRGDVEALGVDFFLAHYVRPGTGLAGKGNGLVIGLLGPMVRDAIVSLGLAGLSNISGDENIMHFAREKYASALSLTIVALQDKAMVHSMPTLSAAVLLALFAMITCDPTERDPVGWGDHVAGAAALTRLHDCQGQKSRSHIRVLMQISYSSFISYLQRAEPLPPDMFKWSQLTDVGEHEYPACLLADMMSTFINLHAAIKANTLSTETIITTASQLQSDLDKWMYNLPSSWSFTTTAAASSPHADPAATTAFEGRAHIYPDQWTASMLNCYRATSILVAESLLAYLPLALSSSDPRITTIAAQHARIARLAADICASVPFHRNLAGSTTTPTHASSSPSPNIQLSGAFPLLWPLKVAATPPSVGDVMHRWLVAQLRDIGRTMGINMALLIARNIETARAEMIERFAKAKVSGRG